jgi:hypothetical protein
LIVGGRVADFATVEPAQHLAKRAA